jgi:hypothetical protein
MTLASFGASLQNFGDAYTPRAAQFRVELGFTIGDSSKLFSSRREAQP